MTVTNTPTSSSPQTTTTTTTMDQDLFHFIDAFAHPSPVGEWFTTDSPPPTSLHSSPEIATPLDVHVFPAPKLDHPPLPNYGAAAIGVGGTTAATDVEMADILNSPIYNYASPQPIESDLAGQDLPSVLAAFVAAVSASSSSSSTPSIPPSTTPSTTTAPAVGQQKRALADDDESSSSPADEAALKRQKNTDAARRSRLKKVMKMDALEKRVHELERMNAQLLLRVAVLDSEKMHLQTKEASHEARVKSLETQLADAHKALSSRSSS
ncbi:hypothetical protein [Absidia glauca]|uniref:BZIP domain-containing protein n=1 Tax=Absidia glauca TaxID=4829 RepID=A0A163K6A1_ABSGL|nr:hypothetical protein [Absidia glauca]